MCVYAFYFEDKAVDCLGNCNFLSLFVCYVFTYGFQMRNLCKVKVKVILEQAIKAQSPRRGIARFFH
jgi:hypothetical protein